jgi:hypothetical protein
LKAKSIILLINIVFIAATGFSQNVNGKWYGVGNVYSNGESNDYLSELLLQQNGNKVSGLYNYFFKDHHISSQITGTYNPSSRTLVIHLLPVLNYSAKGLNNADCAMVGAFTLKISKVNSTLTGAFTPTNQHRFSCPDILVKFTKSDAEGIMGKIEKKPLILEGEDPQEPVLVKRNVVQEPASIKKEAVKEPVDDLVKRRFTSREINIYSDSISVSLYDNSEIDNDTISLFYNRKLIAHKQMLSDKPIKFRLAVDSLEEISMFAENLGRLPPNTALLLVYDGDIRHEVHITSDYVVNGTVRFRRIKPEK